MNLRKGTDVLSSSLNALLVGAAFAFIAAMLFI